MNIFCDWDGKLFMWWEKMKLCQKNLKYEEKMKNKKCLELCENVDKWNNYMIIKYVLCVIVWVVVCE